MDQEIPIVWSLYGQNLIPYRFNMTRGSTQNMYFRVVDPNGNAIDITGWIMWFNIKRYITDLDSYAIVMRKQTSFVDPEQGLIKIQLSPTETVDERPWNCQYYFNVILQDTNNVKQPALVGTIDLINSVSQYTP